MKVKSLFFLALCFIGITSVSAGPFKIGTVEYDSLAAAVDAVPADGTKTTIVMTQDVTNSPGVQIDEGKNVVIDFNNHYYESGAPFVGSPKTQTISFRFMKGATVYLKNGNLKASNDGNSKMFIQNYSDLTLENIKIDATDNNYDYFYGLSSNHGRVYVGEGTSILVNEKTHARAFDMCWAPKVSNGIYADGTQMIIETDDEINGYIELDVWGTYSDEGGIKSTLEIKNIDFHGKWIVDERLKNQLTIDGGRYINPGFSETNLPPAIPTDENPYIDIRLYLKDGNASYNLNDHFYVLPSKHVAYDNDKLFIIKGHEYNFTKNLPSGYEQFVIYEIEDKSIVTVENGILKGIKDGVSKITVILGEDKNGKIKKSFDAIVFDLDAATDYQANVKEGEAIVNVMNIIVSNVIESVLDDNSNEGIDEDTKNNLIAAIEAGKKVDAKIEIKELKESDLDSTLANKIKNSVSNGTLVEFLDIDLLLTVEDDLIGKVTKLNDELTISIDAPESLINVPANTTRKYFIVRTHEGDEPEVIEATLKDGKLIFKTDRFSNYAVGYTDTTNPKTGDRIIAYVALLGISLAALFILKKKRV
ncbi:MAG: hypothetical protein K6E99_03195 [Bacilli bacterium]|nr:hypothetical protein [Bacilli bacterium]